MYYAYIITNTYNMVLYTGVTNDLQRRMQEHKEKLIPGFTAKYRVNKLVWDDTFKTPIEAITAEKKIKGLLRKKKIALIQSMNPGFKDLNGDPSLRSG